MTSLAMNSGYRFESMQLSGMRQLVNTFNDSYITIRAIAESSQGYLVGGAVMGCYCLLNTIKFEQYGALLQPKFIGHRWFTTC